MPNTGSWKRGNIKIVNLADRASLDVNKIEFWEELQPSEAEANETYRHKNSPNAGEQHSDQKFGVDTSEVYLLWFTVSITLPWYPWPAWLMDTFCLHVPPSCQLLPLKEKESEKVFFLKGKFYMSLPLCAVNALSVFWEPVPTSSLFPFMRQSRFPLAITRHSHACM